MSDPEDTSIVPGAFTRWGVRLLGLALGFWGGIIIYRAISLRSEWKGLGEVLTVLSDSVGWTAEGWLAVIRAMIGLMVVGGVIPLALAWGVWRRHAGAWLTLVILVFSSLVWSPINEWLIWGTEAVKSYNWTGWSLHVGFWAAGGWFLLRRETRRFFLKDRSRPWRSWWMRGAKRGQT